MKATHVTTVTQMEKKMIANRIEKLVLSGCLIFLSSSVLPAISFGQTLVRRTGEVKYLSQNSLYIDLGSEQGLRKGDTLTVKRDRRVIGKLVVQNIARLSAACKFLSQNTPIRIGDQVEIVILMRDKVPAATPVESTKEKGVESQLARPQSPKRRLRRRPVASKNNRVKGRFSMQMLSLDDQTPSNRDTYQMAFRSKLKIERFMGFPVALRVRWRSRSHHRQNLQSSEIATDEWRHHFYEFGLVSNSKEANVEFGLGRVLSNRIRGLGYIDGGLFSLKMNGVWRVGVAGGTQPSLRTLAFQTAEHKFGIFLNFEKGEYGKQRVSSTAAFSGRYHKGEVSREFFYLQNTTSFGGKFSLYQTVEIDLNRNWKRDSGHASFQLSNFFLSANYYPTKFISISGSYDARKSVRVYETRSIPDSLFIEVLRQGFHAGITVRLPNRIRLSGNLGIRLRTGQLRSTTSASFGLSVPRIFNSWATLSARLSYFNTLFTKAYRPSVRIRLPVTRGLSVNASGGSYVYQSSSGTTHSDWLEANGSYRINRRLFSSFGYRMFLDERLRSARLSLELGVVL